MNVIQLFSLHLYVLILLASLFVLIIIMFTFLFESDDDYKRLMLFATLFVLIVHSYLVSKTLQPIVTSLWR